ncbi:hypothetical protein SELMODRAFT_443805 [Selaginella moellendorffii]|uniref:Uncharacterized protein n=1 Tax=Selaginella moellendorffii TaxID=88036 RepID=D8S4K1_SELML|nr:putative protein TPRXL [Selaginella moellendorffii]EFJ20764.1 hypothetical protein SELMODRAFT_443805 [Selaginella moellendorffii]|eukprot:XP_002978107.1 putative protein TPRXL [Selaginella moellendorffii]
MGNLMSCVLICGAVEVVHVVHSDGHVERLIRPLDSSKVRKNSSHKRLNSSSFSGCSPPRADLLKCLSNLGGKSSSDGAAVESEPGRSYLLLPITNADDSSGAFQYKRLSSFQFYKSAFLSPKSSSSSKSLVAAPKDKNQTPSEKNGKTRRSPGDEHDDRKLLLKDSSQQPFKVRQEGGVTKLVVSKKYLQQLLSESNVKKSSSSSSSSSKDRHDHRGGAARATPTNGSSSSTAPAALPGAAPPRVGRPGIWRPALESISEAAAAAAAIAAHHPQEP